VKVIDDLLKIELSSWILDNRVSITIPPSADGFKKNSEFLLWAMLLKNINKWLNFHKNAEKRKI